MKKRIFILLGLFSFFKAYALDIEVKVDAFMPTSKIMRDIYGNSGIDYGLEIGNRLLPRLSYFAQINYFHKDGTCIGGDFETTMTLIPIGMGLLYHYYFNQLFDFYLGLGPSLTWVRNRNKFPGTCILPNIREAMIGVVTKGGVICHFDPRVFIDLFIDYNYCKIGIGNSNTNAINFDLEVSGLRIGGGIGFTF